MNAIKHIIRTSCRGCRGLCQVLVHLDKNGRVVHITGDQESPFSRGHICVKGMRAADALYHPDRITAPLLRTKARGQGGWERISWDAATDLIAERFASIRAESGPEYIAIAHGSGRPYAEFADLFCCAMGSPNFVSPAHNCLTPRALCADITIGWRPQPDLHGLGGIMPRCILLFGNNAAETGGTGEFCGKILKTALEQTEKSIVVDPRTTATARESDLHLFPRPGTECALLLGMIHAIIRGNAYDKEFVAAHCTGFMELHGHIRSFTPSWAETTTGVPASKIEEAALAFARLRPSCLVLGNGVEVSVNAFQTARAAYILMAICGVLDVPGGMARRLPPANIRPTPGLAEAMLFLPPKLRAKALNRFPFCAGAHAPTFWQACVSGRPYKPRAIWLIGTNPIVTQTRGDLVSEALRDHLEFVVVSDFFMTSTAALADLVLPPRHWLEQEDVGTLNEAWYAVPCRPIDLVGEALDDREAILRVAHKLGLTEAFPWKSWREHLEWLLEPSGLSFAEFLEQSALFGEMPYKKYLQEGFKTPSGKVELASSILRAMDLPDLPTYEEPPLSPVSRPDLAARYPFIFMTGCKTEAFFHSEGRNIPALRRLHPEPLAEMHPAAAKEAGLSEGQRVRISTPHGTQEFILHMDDRLPKDVVHAEHAWWFPEKSGPSYGCFESNANLLFSHDHFDRFSGAEPLKSGLCRVDPASGAATA